MVELHASLKHVTRCQQRTSLYAIALYVNVYPVAVGTSLKLQRSRGAASCDKGAATKSASAVGSCSSQRAEI